MKSKWILVIVLSVLCALIACLQFSLLHRACLSEHSSTPLEHVQQQQPLKQQQPPKQQQNKVTLIPRRQQQEETDNIASTKTTKTKEQENVKTIQQRRRRKETRLDFKNCPRGNNGRPLISATVDWRVGVGHRMMQWWIVFYIAITNGYCICFDPRIDENVWNLLMKPLFPECSSLSSSNNLNTTTTTQQDEWIKLNLEALRPRSPPRTLQDILTVVHEQVHQHYQNYSSFNKTLEKTIFAIYPGISSTFRHDSKQQRGLGDVFQFAQSIFYNERLIRDIIQPWYLTHRPRKTSAFLPAAENNNVVNLAVHLRVGDLVIESSQEYWDNLMQEFQRIIDFEYPSTSSSSRIHLYLVYFKAVFFHADNHDKTASTQYGKWEGKETDLPKSHAFLARLCQKYGFTCHWKTGVGTSKEETMDCLVTADVVYTSGSSYSQALGFFNPNVKIVAVPKDLNHHGTSHPDFWTHDTSALTSTQYYYINVDGTLYSEQEAYLQLRNK